MEDRKKRNFEILRDKLGGRTHEQLSRKYGLSRTTIANVIASQLSKIAEFDHEFRRSLDSLRRIADENEKHANLVSDRCKEIEQENAYLRSQLKCKEQEILSLEGQLKSLRASARELSERLSAVEKTLVTKDSLRYALEYENINENIKKYRN